MKNRSNPKKAKSYYRKGKMNRNIKRLCACHNPANLIIHGNYSCNKCIHNYLS